MVKLLAVLPLAILASGASGPVPPRGMANMTNPASDYCVQMGGRLEIRRAAAGETGYCLLPDGSVVEEWALFYGSLSGEDDSQ
jgi:uncharacterized protein